jgi:hypothetical protein
MVLSAIGTEDGEHDTLVVVDRFVTVRLKPVAYALSPWMESFAE